MLNIKNIFIILFILYFISCSDNGNSSVNSSDAEIQPYYGTYLLQDIDCFDTDIQYLTIDGNGVSIFDFLGDICDDTVGCYSSQSFELMSVSTDTLSFLANETSDINDGMIQIVSDSLILVSYNSGNERLEYNWKKIKDDIYSFMPKCDQAYENTKNLLDILVYAVSDNGDLLWKNYIHGGIWDLGSSVTLLSDGGYMVYGIFDGIFSSGGIYSDTWDTGDIIKLNSEGQVQWRKEINFGDGSPSEVWHNYIAKSLIETSRGDLVFIAPINGRGVNVVMMDTDGNIAWSQNYPDLSFWNYNSELIETEYGDLAVIGGMGTKFKLLDYYSGEILEQVEYENLNNPRAIINVDDDFAIFGTTTLSPDGWQPNHEATRISLLKISSEGDKLWEKNWINDTTNPRKALDLILTSDYGYLLLCYSDPSPYATLIKTDSEGNEEWRKKYDDNIGNSNGWIHQTEDGGYFMATGYAVTKLDVDGNVEWTTVGPSKYFNNGMVAGSNYGMRKIVGGAVMTGRGSADWE